MILAKCFFANRGRWGSSGVLKCVLDCVCKLLFCFIVRMREWWIWRGRQHFFVRIKYISWESQIRIKREVFTFTQLSDRGEPSSSSVNHLSVYLNACPNRMQVFIPISHCVNSAYVSQTQFQLCYKFLRQELSVLNVFPPCTEVDCSLSRPCGCC